MDSLTNRIIEFLKHNSGLTDREITDSLVGINKPQQSINQVCRKLAEKGVIDRHTRLDGKIGNYFDPGSGANVSSRPIDPKIENNDKYFSEDKVKALLKNWLIEQGWHVQVAWGHSQGIDVEATKGGERWVIEVKGEGSLQPMRVNYFLAILGETLQRMDDPKTQYSIALPDIQQFRKLWNRLPTLAKARTKIGAIFVDAEGRVSID